MTQRIVRCAAAALLLGCAGRTVDVGSHHDGITDGGEPPGTAGDGGLGEWPSPDACRSGAQLPIVGTWEGYMEMANLPSRSDAVKLVITSANASSVCGTITFGTGTPPRVPTDPDNADIPGIGDGGAPVTDFGHYLIDGLPLTILNSKPSLPRLQFEVNRSQFWKPWCELQTPYLREGSNEWYCVPLDTQGSWSWSRETGCLLGSASGGVPVNCAKAHLCSSNPACSCTATGCTVSGDRGDHHFDLRVTGDEIQGPGINGRPMYLTRVR